MLLPSIFEKGFLSNGFEDDFGDFMTWPDESEMMRPLYGKNAARMMKTDVRDVDGNYEIDIDLPGFNKEDIHIDLKNDMLTISASHDEKKDEKDKDGKYIRRERRSASYQRSFRVEDMKPEDIRAQYKNGVLTVTFPKKEAIPEKNDVQRIEVKD